MNPMLRALTARLAKATPGLAGTAGALGGVTGLEFGSGGLVQKPPGGGSWDDYVRSATSMSPNDRVAGAFDALPAAARGDRTQLAPIDRIAQAFNALRQQPAVPAQTMPMNLASHGVVTVPDKVPAAAPASAADVNPMSFFLRNALAQREAPGGDYLNPTVGAQAAASPFKGLFG